MGLTIGSLREKKKKEEKLMSNARSLIFIIYYFLFLGVGFYLNLITETYTDCDCVGEQEN